MATSTITITALTATPTLRGNKLAAVVLAEGPAANLPNLMLDQVEFFASTTNDFSTASKVVEGNPEALHAGLIEEQTYYYWAKPRAVNGSYGAVFPVSPTAGVECTAIGMSGLAFGLGNGKLTASVASSALTITVKTASGNDPTPDDPVYLAFRSATVTDGGYRIRSITAPLSLTISNGSKLGTVNATAFRIWVLLFDDAGTLRLGVKQCVSFTGNVLYPLAASDIGSTTAEGGAGGADDYFVVYSEVAITSKPFRILGSLTWNSGLATAGAWTAGPDVISLFSAESPKPGDVVQEVFSLVDAVNSGTTTIPLDNTIPQSTEGISTSIGPSVTPTSPANMIDFDVLCFVSHTVETPVIGAMFKDAATAAFAACVTHVPVAGGVAALHLKTRTLMGGAASRVYSYRVGGSNAGTVTVNGQASAARLGGTMFGHVKLQEIMC